MGDLANLAAPEPVTVADASGNSVTAPVSTAAPAGTEAGLYVRLVSPRQSGQVVHYNGTATTTPATVNFSSSSVSVMIQNTQAGSNNLLVSFDGGTNFKTIFSKGDFISVDARIASVVVKSSASTVTYEMLVAQ